MEFDKRQRETLIDNLNEAKSQLERAEKVLAKMTEETNEDAQLWQHVDLEVKLFRIKAIEKAIIDNNPFGLDWEFTNE